MVESHNHHVPLKIMLQPTSTVNKINKPDCLQQQN